MSEEQKYRHCNQIECPEMYSPLELSKEENSGFCKVRFNVVFDYVKKDDICKYKFSQLGNKKIIKDELKGVYVIGKEAFKIYRGNYSNLIVETSDGPIALNSRFFIGESTLTKEEMNSLIAKGHPKSKTLENWLKQDELQLMPKGIWDRENYEGYITPDGPGPILPTNPTEDKSNSQSLPKCTEDFSCEKSERIWNDVWACREDDLFE